MARRRTTRQPGGLLALAPGVAGSIKSKYGEAVAETRRPRARPAHCGNARSPPSAKSPGWKEARRAGRKARKAAPGAAPGAARIPDRLAGAIRESHAMQPRHGSEKPRDALRQLRLGG